MNFEEWMPVLLPVVLIGWLVVALRRRSDRKSWWDNLYLSLLCVVTGGVFGMPRLVSIITQWLYTNRIWITNPDSVVVYDGIPFLTASGGFFMLLGEWALILLFFFGLYLLGYTLVRRVKGDKSYQSGKKPAS